MNINKYQFRYLSGSLDSVVYGYLFRGVFLSQGLNILNIVPSVLFVYGVYLLLLQILNNSNNNFKFSHFVYICTSLVVAWYLITFVRGFSFDFKLLFTLFGNPYVGGLFWLLPFCIYIGKQPGVLQSLLPSIKKHAIIGLSITTISVINIFIFKGVYQYSSEGTFLSRELAFTGVELLYGAPIALLTGIEKSSSMKMFYRVCLLFTLLGAIATNQRFYIAIALLYIVLDLIIGRSQNFQQYLKD